MEQGKSKYEVAIEILEFFNISKFAVKKFGTPNKVNPKSHILETDEQAEKALEYYTLQLKKVMSALDND